MSDPFVLDDEPFLLVVPSGAAIPASNITAPEWTALKNRVTNLEAMTVIDLDDVDLTGLSGGDTLIFDNADALWKPGTVQGSIERVGDSATGNVFNDVDYILAAQGVQATVVGDAIMLSIVFGGTGAAVTAARSDHTHTILPDTREPYVASGTLSGGTRALVSRAISLSPSSTYVIKAKVTGDLRGEGTGAGYTLPSVTVNGNTVNRFGEVRTVSGVDRDFSSSHPGVTVTGLSSVTVSASLAYQSGDPINVGAGELVISIELSR